MACRNCGYYPFCEKCGGPRGSCNNEVPKRDKIGEVYKKNE
jgi:hypothetical protein